MTTLYEPGAGSATFTARQTYACKKEDVEKEIEESLFLAGGDRRTNGMK